ncbi:MAG: hypothetical protein ACE5G0_16860 [Rhodothermales bacterium]
MATPTTSRHGLKRTFTFLLAITGLFSLPAGTAWGQDTPQLRTLFPTGISVEYGLGNYSVRDEFFSEERYTGPLPFLSAGLSRFKGRMGYRIGLEFRSSSEIQNHNLSTDITHFMLYQDFLYAAGKVSLFSKDVHVFVGPTMEISAYTNRQNVTKVYLNEATSLALMLSLGGHAEIIVPIRPTFQVEWSVRSSLLSGTIRSTDEEEADADPKLLSALSGMNAHTRLGTRFFFSRHLSAMLSYRLQIMRVSTWDSMLNASNNVIASVTVHF